MIKLQSLIFVLCFCGMVFAAEFPEPFFEGDKVPQPTFGDARNVKLLSDLLADEDVRVRERAVLELGQTHNPAALTQLQRAAKDPSPAVRAAAVRGATELGVAGEKIVLAGLNDKNDAPLLAAMEAVVALKLQDANGALRTLTRHEREIIRYSALRTLTALQQTAKAGDLKDLLSDPSPALRVEALRNAMLLKAGKDLKGDFIQLAEKSNPVVVRAGAIECLGAFVLKPASPAPETQPTTAPTQRRSSPWTGLDVYAKIAKEKNPLLRRAVIRVYRRENLSAEIIPFLSDSSPLVRLAAAQALVNLPDPRAIEPLVKLFLNAPDDETHNTARRALRNLGEELAKRNIGAAPVGRAVAENLPRIMADLKTNNTAINFLQKETESFQKQKENELSKSNKSNSKLDAKLQTANEDMVALTRGRQWLQRNAISCCYLLGVLHRKEGYDELLRLTTELPLNSPILGEIAVALGRIGDDRAIAPLRKVLGECNKQAVPYLKAISSMAAPPPFSEKVTGQVIQALAALGDKESTDTILRLTKLNVMAMRLGIVIAHVLEVIPSLATEEKQKEIGKFLLRCLRDRNLSSLVQWRAARLAGRMKFRPALPALKNILYKDRKCTSLMTMAAWAIQQITGDETPPKIPPPVVRQGDWIITQIE